jgi:16S rRNA (guanine527-N7)-methyltransferase
MRPGRIAELLHPFLATDVELAEGATATTLSPRQLENISTYINVLLRWNAHVNLTAVRNPEEIVTRHFGESLFAARNLFPVPNENQEVQLIDVGSGAGFPGLPIKLWAPHSRLTLIESNRKKVTFLREIIRALDLSDAEVFSGRAEAFAPAGKTLADWVTLRAVERFDSILPLATTLSKRSGHLAIFVGKDQVKRAHQLTPGVTWGEPLAIPLSFSRTLILGRNESPQ